MQRVVRSSLMGLLAIAGLTACGDKVTIPATVTQAPVTPVVRSVTVTPNAATLAQGDKITLAASVNADAGITDRTVSWASANTAIASVDATTGVVTAGTTSGTTTVTASSKADATVKGAALITVTGGAGGAPATVTISTINQTICVVGGGCNSVPANLGNVTGQIDVTLNVDPGAQRLVGVDLILNCSGNGNSGADTVVATQSLASANVASDAAAASAPVTLSFNTGTFNATSGAPAFFNSACTLKARARTNASVGGTITTVTSTSQTITLNNTDVVVGAVSSTKTAVNPNTGLLWNGGDVTVTATPVFFSGRVPATLTATLEGKTVTATGTGSKSLAFIDGNGVTPVAANDIDNVTDSSAVVTFTLVDAAGQPFTNPVTCGAATLCSATSYLANPGAPAAVAKFRLDTQKPKPGTFPVAVNADQGTNGSGYVGASFRFASDSAAGYRGPDAIAGNQTRNLDNNNLSGPGATAISGVDNATVTFQWRVTGAAASTYANVTAASSLNETTSAAGDQLRMITADALGNADTTTVSTFGVDKSPPSLTQIGGPSNQATSQAILGTGQIVDSISDALSGPGPKQLVAQVRQQAGLTSSSTLPANGTVFTNGTENSTGNAGCVIGVFFTTSAAAGANALPVLLNDGTTAGFCALTPYTMNTVGNGRGVFANFAGTGAYVTTRIIAVDQANNQTAPQTIAVVEDATKPTVQSVIDGPITATGGSSIAYGVRASDNLDLTGSFVQLIYTGAPITLQYPATSGPGAAFDNVLTGTSQTTVNPSVPFLLRNIQNNPGAARPATPTGAAAPTTVVGGALDAVNNAQVNAGVAFSSLSSLTQPTTNPWAADFVGGFTVTANNLNVSDCPVAACAAGGPANPTTTTLTAIAAGTTGVFANPFNRVQFWYQSGASPWFFIAEVASTSAISNDTGLGVGRTWAYSLVWTPPKSTPVDPATNAPVVLASPGGTVVVNVRAIGATSNGDGLLTAAIAINLTNP